MSAYGAIIAALITVLFAGIALESYKRHRDLQGAGTGKVSDSGALAAGKRGVWCATGDAGVGGIVKQLDISGAADGEHPGGRDASFECLDFLDAALRPAGSGTDEAA